MSKRLVIIDGKSVFYRGYYAMPNLSTSDGTPTGGVFGFAVMALEVIKRLKPDYVCVAWDKAGTNIRSRLALYPQYKANRKAPPDDFYAQIPILHDLLASLGWPLYEADDYEADDIMGAFAKQVGPEVESYLITSDLDVLQLVNPHTHIYTLKKGLTHIDLFNEASFREKYGIDAHQWVDVKALKGDSSDNVPGVAGVGEKTALDLIATYGTLDGVYEHLDELKPTLRAKLERDRDVALLSKKLVTLMVDMPLKIDLQKAKLHDGFTPEFVAMLRKLEFRQLLRQVEATMAPQTELLPTEFAATVIPPAARKPFAASDFASETPRVLALNPEATELWVSVDAATFAVLPLETLDAAQIEQLVVGPAIGHDLKPVFRALLSFDLSWPGTIAHDTRLGAFLINSLTRGLELEDLLGANIDANDPAVVIPAIWKLYDEQKTELAALPKVQKVAQEIDFPSIYLLATIEHRGITLDVPYLATMSEDFAVKIKQIEAEIYEHAKLEFNIASPAQLGMVLFDKLGLPTQGVKKGKTGYSTGAGELAKLRNLHPIVDLITQYREYAKLKSTYIDALPQLVDKDSKLHTTFAQDVAATGRLSSRDPNLQNIPTRTAIGNAIRTAFVARPGNVFVSADYSQFELRLAAVLAGDQQLIDDFNNDVDIHTATAAQIYDVPPEKVTKLQRRHAKVVNFGIIYGMSPHGLSAATGMTFVEAKQFIDKYFALRKPIADYIDRTLKDALQNGYVETMFGRRRPTPDLKSSNFMVREGAKRAAQNMPVQGTEADLMKLAMLKVETALSGLGEQLLQIHDSILVETPAQNAQQVAKILQDTMEHVHPLPVRLKVDVTTAVNWGEL